MITEIHLTHYPDVVAVQLVNHMGCKHTIEYAIPTPANVISLREMAMFIAKDNYIPYKEETSEELHRNPFTNVITSG